MSIANRKMAADPITVGSSRYTPMAIDTTVSFPVPGGLLHAGYARPLHIQVATGTTIESIRIPDRQLQVMLGAFLVAGLARLIERRRS